MIPHKFGVYWAPAHGQNIALDFIRKIQPPYVLILTEDVQHISDAHAAAPDALIIPRVWAIDDFHGMAVQEILSDPKQAAQSQFEKIYRMYRMWERQAYERQLPWPSLDQVLFPCANEINQGVEYGLANTYFREYCRVAASYHCRALVGRLGVGHPHTLYEDGSVNWSTVTHGLGPVITAGNHVWSMHCYWQGEGPDNGEDYPYLAGRWESFDLDVPFLIEESGVDGGIYDRYPKQGWRGKDIHLTKPEYLTQFASVHERLVTSPQRAIGTSLFSLDYQDKQSWATFDVAPMVDVIVQWLEIRQAIPEPQPPPQPPPPPLPSPNPKAIDPFLALALYNIESRGKAFGEDGRMIIRFEAHIFKQQLKNDPLFNKHFAIADTRPWEKPQYYITNTVRVPIHTGKQSSEYEALQHAIALNRKAAYESISMGVAQVMGFNAPSVGFADAEAMYEFLTVSEVAQITSFFNYVLTKPGLLQALYDRDFDKIALLYNGSTAYSPLLRAEYERLTNALAPEVDEFVHLPLFSA